MVETTVIDNLLTPRQSYVLKGQSDAEEEFFTDANADRLHHAWLIGGPKGVGKATTATVVVSCVAIVFLDYILGEIILL